MKILKISLLGALLTSVVSQAQVPEDMGFLGKDPAAWGEEISMVIDAQLIEGVDYGTVFLAKKIANSPDWSDSVLKESQLFEGYRSFESYLVEQDTNDRVLFGAEGAVVVHKALDQNDLNKLKDPEFLSKMDSSFNHTVLPQSEAVQEFLKGQAEGRDSALAAIEARAKASRRISDQKIATWKERVERQYEANINPSRMTLCSDSESVCMKSSAIFSPELRATMKSLKESSFVPSSLSNKVPDRIDFFSELRSAGKGELEGAQAGVVQTGFLANKFIISTKTKVLAYNLGNQSTLLVAKVYVEVELDDVEKYSIPGVINIRDFMMGESAFNSPVDFRKGLPAYSSDLLKSLASEL